MVHSAVGFLTHHLPCGQPSIQGAMSMVQLSHPSSIRVGGGGLRECSCYSPARVTCTGPTLPQTGPTGTSTPTIQHSLLLHAPSWAFLASGPLRVLSPVGRRYFLRYLTHLLREALLDPPARYGPPLLSPFLPLPHQCLMSPDVYSCSRIGNVCEELPWWSSG